jgi:hypothetical protein
MKQLFEQVKQDFGRLATSTGKLAGAAFGEVRQKLSEIDQDLSQERTLEDFIDTIREVKEERGPDPLETVQKAKDRAADVYKRSLENPSRELQSLREAAVIFSTLDSVENVEVEEGAMRLHFEDGTELEFNGTVSFSDGNLAEEVAAQVVGMPLDEAQKQVQQAGLTVRAFGEDDSLADAVSVEHRDDRVNLHVKDGQVFKAHAY